MFILLIDDQVLFRDGLKLLLSELADDLRFGEADSCEAALAGDGPGDVDIVLTDLRVPGTSGLDTLARIRDALPAATVVVLSDIDTPGITRAAIEAGAAGFIPKSSTRAVLIAALRLIIAGGCYLPPHLLTQGDDSGVLAQAPEHPSTPLRCLSQRQEEVLMAAAQGQSNKAIARQLEICEATVKAHMSAALRTLGVKNRTEAVYALAKIASPIARSEE